MGCTGREERGVVQVGGKGRVVQVGRKGGLYR